MAAHAGNRGGTEGDIDDRLAAQQISLPHGSIVIALRLLIFMCPEKKSYGGRSLWKVGGVSIQKTTVRKDKMANKLHIYAVRNLLSRILKPHTMTQTNELEINS